MSNVLVIGPSYKEHAAVSIRIQYFVEALKKAGLKELGNLTHHYYRVESPSETTVLYAKEK